MTKIFKKLFHYDGAKALLKIIEENVKLKKKVKELLKELSKLQYHYYNLKDLQDYLYEDIRKFKNKSDKFEIKAYELELENRRLKDKLNDTKTKD